MKGSDSEFRLLDEKLQLYESQKRYDMTKRQFEFSSVKATITGTVSKVNAVNLGQHIKQGSLLAEIVPENDKLKIQGQVLPKDIAYVQVNQTASIGFSSYDQSIFPLSLILLFPDTLLSNHSIIKKNTNVFICKFYR